jgi:hypothetical protein
MKKTFIVALLLLSILLIGSVGMALAEDGENCKLYLATVTVDPDTPLPGANTWQECFLVCYEDGFAEVETCGNPYGPDLLFFTLEDFGVDAKNLIGYSTVFDKACHAKLRGGGLRTLEADCLLNMFDGVRIHVKGKAITDERLCPCAGTT